MTSVRRALRRTGWSWAFLIGAAARAAAPIVAVLASILTPSTEVWRHLWETRLPLMIRETALLLVLVVTGAVGLGTTLAWLVTAYQFPGRRLLGWLLVTPIAVPGYVMGFVWLDLFRGWLGARAAQGVWLCAAVLILALYPYVYLLALAAFREQSRVPVDVARSLGCTRTAAWWRVTLPLARPQLAAGAALVGMEVLTDVGTVRLFNVSTLADGVLRVWFGLGSRNAATELAVLLVVAAVVLVALERRLRGRARYATGSGSGDRVPRQPVRGWTALTVVGPAVVVLVVAVGVPVARLVDWVGEARRTGQSVSVAGDVGDHLVASARVAGAATLACLLVGVVLALQARRRGRAGRPFVRLATLGYAVPGPVVAVGVVMALAAWDRRGWWWGDALLVGSMVGLVYGLAVRYLAVGFNGIEASLDRVSPNVVASARTLGAGPMAVATRVELPLARAGLLAAGALVAIDVLKELPITLLLRPFGVDTLSVWVWQATSESLWAQAAVPSLAIVVVGMVAVALLLAALEHGAEVTS
jgi:iron(III) transport system permease protein